jgi:hypothetical protein
MKTIEFEQGAFTVDADVVAAVLGIEPALVQPLMRDGKITSVCERGVGEDAGRYRLTFVHANRAFHLVVDEEGHVIERSTHDVGARWGPIPGPKRKPVV